MYSHIGANKRKTLLLMALFVVLISGLGWLFSEIQNSPQLFIFVTIFSVVYAIFGYFASARIALAMTGAKPVSKKEVPVLYRVVENLAITSGLPMPKIYLIDDPAPNAFATGRSPDHSVVAVTSGLLDVMDKEELEGVIAHELSHVGNYDIRLMAVVIVLVTIVAYISNFFLRMLWWGGNDNDNRSGNGLAAVAGLVLALIAPLVATLLQLAVSRKREYLADASGALLTRYPEGLARALAKISSYERPMRRANTATAHLFLASPLRGKRGGFLLHLFSTHPPVEDRIEKLRSMGSEL